MRRVVLEQENYLAASASLRSARLVCAGSDSQSSMEACMQRTVSLKRCSLAIALAAAVLMSPAAGVAQLGGIIPTPPPIPTPVPIPTLTPPSTTASSVTGSASAISTTILGMTTELGSTGTLSGVNDSRDASMVVGSLPAGLSGETLSASTISWADQVASRASLANLNMTVAGIGIRADLVMAQASQALGAAGSGSSTISNLAIGGLPINVTGAPNQTVAIPGGLVTINEQTNSSTGAAGWQSMCRSLTRVGAGVMTCGESRNVFDASPVSG